VVGVALVAAVLGGAPVFADDAQHAPATAAPRTYALTVGAESPDMALQVNSFLPGPIDVHTGDTITWRVESTEFHTVSFLSGSPAERFEAPTPDGRGLMVNPAAAFPVGGATFAGTGIASSGVLNKDQTYSLTFTKPGVFEYVCLVHPEMKGEVRVIDPEAPRAAVANVSVGDGEHDLSLMRFVPGDLEIRVGESVAFANQDASQMPHTVTFRAGRPSPEMITPQPQPAGPPLLVFNPDVIEPRGAADAFKGDEYLNSGMLVQGGSDKPFVVTFTQPGTYEYICALHENMGMRGTITVLP
jgi:plastocyanin